MTTLKRPARAALASAIVMLAALSGAALPARAAKPPNVVMILADDLGFSDVGVYGGEIATPNLDRLAAGGVRFTQFYNTARCWPSRAALLTGYYPQQVNRDPARRRPTWAALLPDLLRPAGYRSYHSGKWHVDGPVLEGGFARSYSLDDLGDYFAPVAHRLDDEPLPRPGPDDGYYSTTAIASHAIDWLDGHHAEHPGEPFFLYVAFTAPHFPLQALPEDFARYRGRYAEGWDVIRERRWNRQRELGIVDGPLSPRDPETVPPWNLSEEELQRRIGPGEVGRALAWESLTAEQKAFQADKMAVHAAMVDRMDREIGRILERLEAVGALDDTLILFASDNGASAEQLIRSGGHDPSAPMGSARTYLGVGPGWSTAANTPYRLHKYWNYEGGVSTPLIAHWPAGIKARGEIRRTPGHLIDVAPTLLELAGLEFPKAWKGADRPTPPGRSLAPVFAADAAVDRPFLYFHHEGNRGLRVGDWKIVAPARPADAPWQLYDLANDRAEAHDLAAEHPEKVQEMAELWSRQDEEFRRQRAAGPLLPELEPGTPR
ncbi:arylsulfatase [Planctomyces sp. SH-PL62]|uniref:arylsulfatase n=1 Tax=Planctomyces sp. SH-PL62 TaxID=1636152 RepID=UPI00078CED5A|nr:arylsulfatase [Planctomyces sp. SH-PL62]AMV38144.1 Arylsulfatase [Planctomyces sp. SH-PL62]